MERSESYYKFMDLRRTVRDFSDKDVPIEIVENLVMTASSAPSGAHKQPWTFCVVGDPEIKKKIREAAEKEEYESYHHRMSGEWLEDLAPLGTDWHKPFLETAPWLVICFKRAFEWKDGARKKNYYVNDSVGLACGFFLAAAHNAGLVALTQVFGDTDNNLSPENASSAADLTAGADILFVAGATIVAITIGMIVASAVGRLVPAVVPKAAEVN